MANSENEGRDSAAQAKFVGSLFIKKLALNMPVRSGVETPPLSWPNPFLRLPYQQAVAIQPAPVQQISTQAPSHEISRWQNGPIFADAAGADAPATRMATSMNRIDRRRASRCFSMMFSFVVGDFNL